jgi:hypothetical protein
VETPDTRYAHTDVRSVLPAVQPALLLVHGARREAVAEADHIASMMPHAEVRKMPGDAWKVDELPVWAAEPSSEWASPNAGTSTGW